MEFVLLREIAGFEEIVAMVQMKVPIAVDFEDFEVLMEMKAIGLVPENFVEIGVLMGKIVLILEDFAVQVGMMVSLLIPGVFVGSPGNFETC